MRWHGPGPADSPGARPAALRGGPARCHGPRSRGGTGPAGSGAAIWGRTSAAPAPSPHHAIARDTKTRPRRISLHNNFQAHSLSTILGNCTRSTRARGGVRRTQSSKACAQEVSTAINLVDRIFQRFRVRLPELVLGVVDVIRALDIDQPHALVDAREAIIKQVVRRL